MKLNFDELSSALILCLNLQTISFSLMPIGPCEIKKKKQRTSYSHFAFTSNPHVFGLFSSSTKLPRNARGNIVHGKIDYDGCRAYMGDNLSYLHPMLWKANRELKQRRRQRQRQRKRHLKM